MPWYIYAIAAALLTLTHVVAFGLGGKARRWVDEESGETERLNAALRRITTLTERVARDLGAAPTIPVWVCEEIDDLISGRDPSDLRTRAEAVAVFRGRLRAAWEQMRNGT